MSEDAKSDLERVEELFSFLQGQLPEVTKVSRGRIPKLTADQAWTVIWYLGNEYWQVPDHIQRCGVCGELFDSNNSGDCLDYGNPPYHFCDTCREMDVYVNKMRRNPDKDQRSHYFQP